MTDADTVQLERIRRYAAQFPNEEFYPTLLRLLDATTAERDSARRLVDDIDGLTAERDAALAEVRRLEGRGRAMANALELQIDNDRLHSLLAEAGKALEPFAKDADGTDKNWAANRKRGTLSGIEFTVGDCRQAAAVLAKIKEVSNDN